MSKKPDSTGLDAYLPLILTAAFLLGCFMIALSDVRSGAQRMTVGVSAVLSGSASEESDPRQPKKSKLMQSGSLHYRLVSPTETHSKRESREVTAPVAVSSEPSVSSEAPSQSAPEAVTSEPEPVDSQTQPEQVSSQEEEEPAFRLPNSHYINFTPPKEGRVAYLTFDDGPSSNTDDILDILDYYNVKATFFVIYHKDMENQYKAIVDRGHTIGLHTYSHNYARIYRSEKAFFNDLDRIDAYIYSVTGVHSKIIRFPGGSSNTVSRHYSTDLMPVLKESATRRGYAYHDWNVDSEDAAHNNLDPDKLLANVKRDLTKYRKPDILMHDSGGSKRTTVEALPEIIEYIYAQGYKMEGLQLDSYAVHHNW